jgi:endonuclease YncB( thermonuclease family)
LTLNGKIVELYDGDTCKIILPVNNVFYKFNCRLSGIDTPEMKPAITKPNREKEIVMAKTARNELFKLICLNNKCLENINITKKKIETTLIENKNLVTVKCLEFDKYGRLLVELYGTDPTKSFNQILVEKNLAVEYNGDKKINPWT